VVQSLRRFLSGKGAIVAAWVLSSARGLRQLLERVGEATYVDVTRRTDRRASAVWTTCGPWSRRLARRGSSNCGPRTFPGIGAGGGLFRGLRLKGTTLAAQVTVTGLSGTQWSPGRRQSFCRRGEVDRSSRRSEHVAWRYDPVIPTVHDLDRFRRLAAQGATLG